MKPQEKTQPLLRDNGVARIDQLSAEASARLEQRVVSDSTYSMNEIAKVSELDPYVFPEEFELAKDNAASVRSLCTLSQTDLKPARSITSHRKFIGPLIVALKRGTWPMIKFHLTDTFKGITQFNSWAVHTLCTLIYRQKRLEKELDELREELAALKRQDGSSTGC